MTPRFRLCYPLSALFAIGWLAISTAFAGQPLDLGLGHGHPDDPFAEERAPVRATEIGTARGQVRASALAALIDGNSAADDYLGGQLAVEFMLHEYGGVRIAGFQELWDAHFQDRLVRKLSSIRVGPALHLSPYRRVDFGVYAEGGIVIADFIDGQTSDKAPEATLGGFVTVHVDSFIFLQAEFERAWANVELNGTYLNQDRTAAMIGLGVAF